MTLAAGCGGSTFQSSDGGGDGGGTQDSGVDRTGFDLTLCEGSTYNPVSGVTETSQVDYLEQRIEQYNYTDAMLAPLTVLAKDGTACATATMKPVCTDKLGSMRTQAGWMTGDTGGPAQIQQWEYLAYTRGDEVSSITTPEAVKTFVAPIDTVKDAALVLTAIGHRIVCDGRPNGRKTASGFEIITQSGYTCGGPGISENIVSVSTSGATAVLHSVIIKPADMMCAIGRRPEGLAKAMSGGEGIGAFFATAAHLEAASVVAFERLAEELRAHGAPDDLVRDALRAAKDEVRHARATKNVAERHGAKVEDVCVDERPIRDLFAIAIENAVEGCVRETFGALVATYQAKKARDPMIARLMKQIAKDETRHADLAWRVAAWAQSLLDEEQRAYVVSMRTRAAAELRAALEIEPEAELMTAAGMPNAHDACALFDGVAAELWAA
jgi:hypothetical protein